MKRPLLLAALSLTALTSCSLVTGLNQLAGSTTGYYETVTPSVLSADPAPVVISSSVLSKADGSPYIHLSFVAGTAPAYASMAHLVGPQLSVNDTHCRREVLATGKEGLACALGTIRPGTPAIINVTELTSAFLNYQRMQDGPVYTSLQ